MQQQQTEQQQWVAMPNVNNDSPIKAFYKEQTNVIWVQWQACFCFRVLTIGNALMEWLQFVKLLLLLLCGCVVLPFLCFVLF